MILKKIQSCVDAAELLGAEDINKQLSILQKLVEDGSFPLTFLGHYSSGKSSLINAIINLKILPVKRRESTAVVTYLRYSEHERAELTDIHGVTRSIDISDIEKIHQNAGGDYSSGLDNIKYINIYINHYLLKNGLVLVDTPGINTMINKHRELAASAIETSGKVLYVLGGAPSNTDRQFIKNIMDCGVDISFIRTHCDLFSSLEEMPEESLEKEKKLISSIISKQDFDYTGVSTVSTSKKWFEAINDVRAMIMQISNNLSAELASQCSERLGFLKEELLRRLDTMRDELQFAADGNRAALETKRATVSAKIKNLESLVNKNEATITKQIHQAQENIRRIAEIIPKSHTDRFRQKINDTSSEDIERNAKIIYQDELNAVIRRIHAECETELAGIISEVHSIAAEKGVLNNMDEPPVFTELVNENQEKINYCISQLKLLKQEIEELREKSRMSVQDFDEESSAELEMYDAAIDEINAAIDGIPSDIAMCEGEPQNKVSETFRTIGELADWALLFLPGKAIEQGTKALLKGVVKLPQGVQIADKIAKGAMAADKAQAVVFGGKKLLKGVNSASRANAAGAGKTSEKTFDAVKGNGGSLQSIVKVLDVLSIGHWAEKIGTIFDKPPEIVVDINEMNKRNAYRNNLLAERQRLSNKRLEEKLREREKLGVLNSERQRLELEAAEKQRVLEETELCYSQYIKDGHRKAVENFRREYINYFRGSAEEAVRTISKSYINHAEQNIVLFAARQTAALKNALETEMEHFENLLQSAGDQDTIAKLEKCKCSISALEEME